MMASLSSSTQAICCWVPKFLPAHFRRQLSSQTLAKWACPITRHCRGLQLPRSQIRNKPVLVSSSLCSVGRLFARRFTPTSPVILSYGYLSNSSILNQHFVPCLSGTQMQVRTVTRCSKNKGKRKTVKAVAKRFIRTGSGKLKYWPPGNVHNMLAKSRKKRLQLRKAKYVTKTQLKTLNKMISGW